MESRLHKRRLERDCQGPLAGVRVLDLTRVLVGNAITVQLGDFGAEVIKIEQPGEGDGLRALRDNGIPVYWKVLCRNKKSIVVDLKTSAGIALVRDLARQSHILVENFKPGALEGFGIGPDVLLEANPRLVIVRASGWGNTGPYRDKLGFGTLIEAFSGFAAKSGFPDSPPLLPNLGLADLVCGLNGAFAAMVALREAERPGGTGQVVDLGILDAMAALLGPDTAAYKVTGTVPARVGNRGAVVAPRNLYRTADEQFLALSCSTQSMMRKLAHAMGRPELMDDPRFRTNTERVKHVDVLDAIVAEFIGRRSLADNLALFDSFEITAGPVNDVALFMNDPHVIEREIVFEVEDPDVEWLPMPHPAARLSATPASIRSTAPRQGEHTRDVLLAAGYSAARIEQLLSEGVIEAAPND